MRESAAAATQSADLPDRFCQPSIAACALLLVGACATPNEPQWQAGAPIGAAAGAGMSAAGAPPVGQGSSAPPAEDLICQLAGDCEGAEPVSRARARISAARGFSLTRPRASTQASAAPSRPALSLSSPAGGAVPVALAPPAGPAARRPVRIGADRVLCDITRTSVSDEQCEDFRAQVATVQSRNAYLKAAETMIVGATYRVSASVGSALDPDPQGPDNRPAMPVQHFRVAALPNMSARLTGEAFMIEPRGWQDAPESAARDAMWEWTVKPERAGERVLRLTIVPRLATANGGFVQLAALEQQLPVKVEVAPSPPAGIAETIGSWASGWEKALLPLTGLVIAFAGLREAIKKLRPKSEASAA